MGQNTPLPEQLKILCICASKKKVKILAYSLLSADSNAGTTTSLTGSTPKLVYAAYSIVFLLTRWHVWEFFLMCRYSFSLQFNSKIWKRWLGSCFVWRRTIPWQSGGKVKKFANIRCLEKPYLVKELQFPDWEEDAIWHMTIFKSDCIPQNLNVGQWWMWK